jgi:anaerobic selenocysteine-containing dehydrogenase
MTMRAGEAGLTRRRFLAGGALLGGLAGAGPAAADPGAAGALLRSRRPDAPYDLNDPANLIHSACMNCNTGCGITVKVQDGLVAKIDGNPYSPWSLVPHLPMSTSVEDAARVDGALCPKGQAGIQTLYDPYRIRKVLKRAGRRGENHWITIDFAQAVEEILEGGRLLAHVPGEEDREVEGLRAIMALRDPDAAKAMAADVKAI